MKRRVAPHVAMILLLFTPCTAMRAVSREESYEAVTTNNPSISVDQLKWMVKPLTREELTLEADAWLALLKSKVRAISDAEIAVKRRNENIVAAKDVAKKVEKAKVAAEKVAASKDAGDAAAADTAEVRKKATEAVKALEDAEAVEAKSVSDTATDTTRKLIEEKKGPVTGATDVALESVDTNKVAEGQVASLSNAVKVAKAKVESGAAEKMAFLDVLTDLRDERTALIDRFNVVLGELEAKGGEIERYVKYREAVSEVIVDVSDTSALLTFVTGWLQSEKGGIKWAVNAAKFTAIMVAFWVLSVIMGKVTDGATSRSKRMSSLLKDFLNIAVRRAALLVGIMVGISAMGIPIGPVLAVITAAGFVVGLALQGTLSNFASGLLILAYRPFDVKDAIEAGGVAGVVTAMNLMSTQIKTWDNKLMIVPNNNIWGNVITNITGTDKRRVDMVFGISYGDSIEKAQAVLERIVNEHPKTLKDPAPVVAVHELGDSSVNFVVRPWAVPADYWAVYWSITRQVKECFDKEGISIPFPQRDVHLFKEG